jgi:hypothetical protein
MARWYRNEPLQKALAREGRGIVKSAGEELLSIASLGFYRPRRGRRRGQIMEIRYPSGKVIKFRR